MPLDLNALHAPPIQIKMLERDGGKVVDLIDQSAENMKAFAEKAGAAEGSGDVAAASESIVDLLAFLAPAAPRDALSKLDRPLAQAIIRHWAGAAREAVAKESADFKAAAADPTSPG